MNLKIFDVVMKFRYILIVTAIAVLFGCTGYEMPDMGERTDADGSIVMSFSTSGRTAVKAYEDTGKESTVKKLDIFVFEADGDKLCVHYQHIDNPATNRTVLEKKRKDFESGREYIIYMIANCNENDISTTGKFDPYRDGKGDLDAFRSMVCFIDQPYLLGQQDDDRFFLMDGMAYRKDDANKLTNIILNDGTPTENLELGLTLRRAVAKIILDIKAKEDDPANEKDSELRFLTEYTDDAGNTVSAAPLYKFAVNNLRRDAYLVPYQSYGIPNDADFMANELINIGLRYDENQIFAGLDTYVNAHNWSEGAMGEFPTYLVLGVPVGYKENAAAEEKEHVNNFYKIPLGKDAKIDRNRLYKITAKIGAPGATDVFKPVELGEVSYETVDWVDTNIDIGGDDTEKPKYLAVNNNTVVMKNVSEDNSIVFASSDPVTVTVTEVHYVDKDGEPQKFTDQQIADSISVSTDNTLNGHILINSSVPKNNHPRFFTIELSHKEENTIYKETINVEQYPLDYVNFVTGYFSYRDDFGGTTYLKYVSDRIVIAQDPTKSSDQPDGVKWNLTSGWALSGIFDTGFWAQVYENNSINYYYYAINSIIDWNIVGKTMPTGGKDNPRMYKVNISSTSKQYALGLPKLDSKGWTDGGTDNANIVCPSFMIASELGELKLWGGALEQEYAASHCGKYVETHIVDGVVYKFDDWRLPTAKEIDRIIYYQNTGAIDKVLGFEGDRFTDPYWTYWAASGAVSVDTSKAPNLENVRVRCVRNAFDTKGTPEQ